MSTDAKVKQPRAEPAPPGNTGTHWTGPNTYLLSQITRANYITATRHPFSPTSANLATQLQRLVHFEGNRPPNRKILLTLRLLTYYPPCLDLIADLILLLESENPHICRLAHYHVRTMAPISDTSLYRELVETLEREVIRPSPARRAAATKTLAKVFHPSDHARATDFVTDVFNCIGGARVKDPEIVERRTVAGIEIPGSKKVKPDTREKKRLGINTSFLSKKVVAGESYDAPPDKSVDEERVRPTIDDGAGGVLTTARGNAEFVKSKFGKMLLGHTVFAALRKISRVASSKARIESYLLDSGLMSIVPSTVRHCIALLELRSLSSPGPVSRYLAQRLPHKNPPANKKLHLEELGARVYFARLLSALAEDPDLSQFIPDEAPKQAQRDTISTRAAIQGAISEGVTYKEKAGNLFKFLFNKERVTDVVSAAKRTTSSALTVVRPPRLRRDDPLGVEFAEALVNLLKNASNRVLLEVLRGLSRRRWTTWFESPIPAAALYDSPVLKGDDNFGGTADAWGVDDEDDDDDFGEDENELGAYEDDITGADFDDSNSSLNPKADVVVPDLEIGNAEDNDTWFSRLNKQRKERRATRIDQNTPFYLRRVGQGTVPALEVILRRIYRDLLEDQPARRFAAAEAAVVLARAKIYGHSRSEHEKLRKAQQATANIVSGSRNVNSQALIVAQEAISFESAKHPLSALVRPLAELVDEDPNPYIRGRAAVALLFIIASGAGRNISEPENADSEVKDEIVAKNELLQKTPLLLRYFRNFVVHENAGSGVGLRLMSELVDYLVYEVLDIAPELGPSAVELTELWAMTHPTVGVCGRLGAMWEKALSIGQGEDVGKSIFRAVASTPQTERVASAAVIFLRRRTLDLSVITVGSFHLAGQAVPEPLPRAIGMEMERYFSLLWHAALLGPSAECRTFAVEALGGAAVLAGEPFRVCTYERLVELVRMRGFGLKIPAEHVLNCLDMLYFSRERFSEARAHNGIARDGSNTSKKWLKLTWRLAAESCAAAQILLGVPPPNGWQPLGLSGAADLKNAEKQFGDVRDRQDLKKLKDTSVATNSASTETPHNLGKNNTTQTSTPKRVGSRGPGSSSSSTAIVGFAPKNFDRYTSGLRSSQNDYPDDVDGYEAFARQDPKHGIVGNNNQSDSLSSLRIPGSRSDRELRERAGRSSSRSQSPSSRYDGRRRSSVGRSSRQELEEQERTDFELAKKLQDGDLVGEEEEMFGHSKSNRDLGKELRDGVAVASGVAEKLWKSGSKMTAKAIKGVGKKAAMESLKGSASGSRRTGNSSR